MTSVLELFNDGFKLGVSVQTREHNKEIVDGKKEWNQLEEKTGELKDKNLVGPNGSNIKYNDQLNQIYERMDQIISKFEMDKNEFNPKSNHFFCQLKNLVKAKSNFNVQLNRVMQLGFNAGQLSVYINKNTLLEDRRDEIKKFVEKYKMFDLETYINKDTQKIINEQYFKSELKGGSDKYYEKYLKYANSKGISLEQVFYKKYLLYKSKYLKLKQMAQ